MLRGKTMRVIKQKLLTGERALYNSEGLLISDSTFADGESPLKESSSISLDNCIFKWKYPLWYCTNIDMKNSTLLETARSGIWYTHKIGISDSVIDAPKTFRRSSDIRLKNVSMPRASETLWSCNRVSLDNVNVTGDYFGMNSENIVAENLTVSGNYAFDGGKNIEIRDSKLLSKDAFWNCENVTVYNSLIIGEYLGWNSKNVTLVNCTIESNQGMCYMGNLVMKNCKLLNTDLAFEYSTVNAQIVSEIDSVKNPISGRIEAEGIGEIIHDEKFVDVGKTEIVINGK